MTDLVERLRDSQRTHTLPDCGAWDILGQAADEIERLRKERDEAWNAAVEACADVAADNADQCDDTSYGIRHNRLANDIAAAIRTLTKGTPHDS